MLQQQIMQLTPTQSQAAPPSRPALSFAQPNIIVEPDFQPVVEQHASNTNIETSSLAACGEPAAHGSFEQIDSWETGFMGRIAVKVSFR